jgi:hypothetical protein
VLTDIDEPVDADLPLPPFAGGGGVRDRGLPRRASGFPRSRSGSPVLATDGRAGDLDLDRDRPPRRYGGGVIDRSRVPWGGVGGGERSRREGGPGLPERRRRLTREGGGEREMERELERERERERDVEREKRRRLRGGDGERDGLGRSRPPRGGGRSSRRRGGLRLLLRLLSLPR